MLKFSGERGTFVAEMLILLVPAVVIFLVMAVNKIAQKMCLEINRLFQ